MAYRELRSRSSNGRPQTHLTVFAVASRQITDGIDKAPEHKTRQLLRLSSCPPLHWGCSMSAEAVVQEQLSGAARTPLSPGVDLKFEVRWQNTQSGRVHCRKSPRQKSCRRIHKDTLSFQLFLPSC